MALDEVHHALFSPLGHLEKPVHKREFSGAKCVLAVVANRVLEGQALDGSAALEISCAPAADGVL